MMTLGAVSLGAALVPSACSSAGGRGAARDVGSWVAPFLRSDSERRPPSPAKPSTLGQVLPGQQVTVFGWWYYAGPCNDVFATGGGPSPARPDGSVPLRLTTSDDATRVVAAPRPSGEEATFAATFVVPNDAAVGPARISDDQGHVVTLIIGQR